MSRTAAQHVEIAAQRIKNLALGTLRAVADKPSSRWPCSCTIARCDLDEPRVAQSSLLKLREAVPTDGPQILAFIRELAEYERLAHEVVATEEGLREHLFGERPMAEVVIGEWDGEPVGFALFFHNFSTFLGQPGMYLEDLYVRPSMRGRGIGKAMLAHLARIAVARGCARFEWSVLDWNEPAIAFYRSLGAEAMEGWTVQRVTGAALDRLAAGGMNDDEGGPGLLQGFPQEPCRNR